MRRKGFTLIELLVVIAIIAILAAILFPVFATARAKARQAACLSNVKQLSLAIIMYASDWDQHGMWTFGTGVQCLLNPWAEAPDPRFWWFDDPLGASYGWYADPPAFLQPYVKNRGLWVCPSDTAWDWPTTQDVIDAGRDPNAGRPWACCSSAPWPCYVSGKDGAGKAILPYDVFAGKEGYPIGWTYQVYFSPANMEGPWSWSDLASWAYNYQHKLGVTGPANWSWLWDGLHPAVNGGFNCGYLDGHAKWSKIHPWSGPVG